jgi:hypothetical protein
VGRPVQCQGTVRSKSEGLRKPVMLLKRDTQVGGRAKKRQTGRQEYRWS